MKTVLILSGGMDSATLAYEPNLGELLCLSFDYGQRHIRELHAAAAIAKARGADHRIIRLCGFAGACPGSSLTDPTVATPRGHYEAPTMKQTVVPSRNAIMLATAFGIAVANRADQIATAVHAGDHAIYPDCREPFIRALEDALNLGVWSDNRVTIHAPYLRINKTNIAKHGSALGVPYALTYTCYEGGERHCGLCGACQERREAFHEAGVSDPTVYECST